MNLHEYQAKSLFARYGIPAPDSVVIRDLAEVARVAEKLGGGTWIVKAQIHAGGRGKGGGVRRVHGVDELCAAVEDLLGQRLITPQTGSAGLPVNSLLVEASVDIRREYYLGLLVDRARGRITIMASAAGGMDIEKVAAEAPDKILAQILHPATGLMPFDARKLGFALGLSEALVKDFTKIVDGLYRLFVQCDASLIEINPLVVTGGDRLLALDAKINLDGNALYRHPELVELRDAGQENPREAQAKAHDLNYIKLDGNIGCMVNGAGLAMATMDLIKLHGGEPANFLDVGGDATAERVAAAFKLLVSDEHVKAVLVNIFGGIVRCDLIAEGIIRAVRDVRVGVPVVARLEGTNAESGRELLAASRFDIVPASDLTDAAEKVIAAAG